MVHLLAATYLSGLVGRSEVVIMPATIPTSKRYLYVHMLCMYLMEDPYIVPATYLLGTVLQLSYIRLDDETLGCTTYMYTLLHEALCLWCLKYLGKQ